MSDLFNQDSEVAVLSILLTNPHLVYSEENVRPYMFSSSTNQLLYSAIEDLSQQNLVPEKTLLINYLTGKGKLKDAGGVEYINYLANQNFNPDNLKGFTDNIVNNYKVRTLISVTADTAKKINEDDVGAYISFLRHTLDNLDETSGGEQVSDMLTATKETWDEIVARVQNPGIRGISTGLHDLDVILGGFVPTNYLIIAGRPGSGKTASLVNLSLAVAKQGKGSLIVSREMDKQSIVERMLAIDTGIQITDIRLGSLNQLQVNKISDSIKKLKSYPIYIDTNYISDINSVCATIRKYKRLHDIEVVFIDYAQLLAERSDNQTMELGRISRELKLLANDLKITVVLYSQLSRAVEQRDDKRPVLSDLRQSGNLEEDPDVVIFLYRDYYYNQNTKDKESMEWIIRKNRFGPIGTLFFKFELETNKVY